MDTIHCFYKHCDDLGMRTRIQNEEQDEHEENDVVNESIKKRNQMVSTKRKMHETYVGSSKKFSKFNQLSVDPDSKDDSPDANKNDKMYCFGSEFVYDYDDEHIFHHDNYTAIIPTYNSLKEELIQNEIATVSMHQFQIQHKKANLHFNTPYCKSNFGDIKVEHLLALMFYCNYDTLQAQFSLTYRQSIPKTNQFYHWGRLLKEAVHKYGTTIQDGDVKVFYHGISEQLLFPEIIGNNQRGISIYCPLSTSDSISVALNFAKEKDGLITVCRRQVCQGKVFFNVVVI
eukprot:909198_1